MNLILVKMFATALALGQVTTRPDAVKTEFDPIDDQVEVVQILKDGCAHMRKAFDIEDLNLDDLIDTALQDPQMVDRRDQGVSRHQFRRPAPRLQAVLQQGETVENSPFDIGEVIEFYNKAVADLPDHNKLKGLKLPGTSVVLDGKGERFAELFESDHRRTWVPLSAIPEYVQQAFIAAEDKRFYQHKGIDERGLIRAFISNLAQPGRPQGGSTITQQVAKNLLVGDDVSYERKIREMIVAARLDTALSKAEILEVYLNSIFLGRGSWGIDMAARSYFKKPASALSLTEGALLAGMAKGPAYFSPDRSPERSRERYSYVLKRMAGGEGRRGRSAHPAHRRAAAHRALREAAARNRLPLRRSPDARGAHARRHAVADGRSPTRCVRPSTPSCSAPPKPRCRTASRATKPGTHRAQFTGPEVNLGETVARVDTEQRTRAQRRGRAQADVADRAAGRAAAVL